MNPFFGQNQINSNFHYNQTTVAYDNSAQLTRVILSGDALPNPRSASNANPNHAGAYHMGLNGGWVNTQPTLASVGSQALSDILARHAFAAGVVGRRVQRKTQEPLLDGGLCPNERGPIGALAISRPIARAMTRRMPTPSPIVEPHRPPSKRSAMSSNFLGPGDTQMPQVPPQCPGNEEALDELNDSVFPTPDEQGTKFITVKPPKKPLEPGESFTFQSQIA